MAQHMLLGILATCRFPSRSMVLFHFADVIHDLLSLSHRRLTIRSNVHGTIGQESNADGGRFGPGRRRYQARELNS